MKRMKRHGRAERPCRPGRLQCLLSPVRSRTADRTAVGVAVDASACLDSLNLIIEPPERGFVPDVQLCCVLLGMDLVIDCPDYEEQIKIGDFLRSIDNTITLHQRELNATQEKKKAMMQLLLTGLIRVND